MVIAFPGIRIILVSELGCESLLRGCKHELLYADNRSLIAIIDWSSGLRSIFLTTCRYDGLYRMSERKVDSNMKSSVALYVVLGVNFVNPGTIIGMISERAVVTFLYPVFILMFIMRAKFSQTLFI